VSVPNNGKDSKTPRVHQEFDDPMTGQRITISDPTPTSAPPTSPVFKGLEPPAARPVRFRRVPVLIFAVVALALLVVAAWLLGVL
jgi:hypothetical protein